MLSGNDIERSYEYRDLAHVFFGATTFPLFFLGCQVMNLQLHWDIFSALCLVIGLTGGVLFLNMSKAARRRHFKKLQASGVSQVTQTGRFFR